MSDLAAVLQGTGDRLASSGHALVERFGALNFWTAALLGSALVLDRVLSRRARASWRIALYAPVGLRVVMPLDWSLHLTNAPRVVPFLAPPMRVGGTAGAELSTSLAPSWYALAAVAYVAVVALLAVRAIAARVRLGRAIAGARPVPRSLEGVPCPVVEHEDLGPMAVGLVAPRIVLPRRLLVAGEAHALKCVLRHEAAHLRRHDEWLSAAMQLLAIAAWPVVPLWLAIARVRQLVELACDEAAVAGADATERRRYGHALLDIAAWRSVDVAPLGAGELHFGSTLRARIEALASQRHWPPVAQAIALSLAPIALIAACASTDQRPSQDREAPRSAAAAPSVALPAPVEDKDYGYEFAVDPAKTGAPAPPAPPSQIAVQDGRVPPETIQAIVRSHYSAFQACYEAGLKKDPHLAGTVAVRFVFGEDGITKEAVIDKGTSLPDQAVIDKGTSLPDQDVALCVVSEFRKLTYPKAKAGGVATVVYPIEFAP